MNFQEQVQKQYEKEGYLVLKVIRLNQSGFPDLQCLKDGKTIWIECKEENDTLKPLQKIRIDQLIDLGFEAFALKKGVGVIYPVRKVNFNKKNYEIRNKENRMPELSI